MKNKNSNFNKSEPFYKAVTEKKKHRVRPQKEFL